MVGRLMVDLSADGWELFSVVNHLVLLINASRPDHVVVLEDKAIGLCCEKCQAKFEAEPKKFIGKVVADVK